MFFRLVTEIFFNQIKGRDIVAHFDSSELRKMDVLGNAQSVYYPLDDEGSYVGVNKTICSEMTMFFGNNTIEEILFITQLEGSLEPMAGTDHDALKLPGFNWQGSPPRPRSIDDLFGPSLRVVAQNQPASSTLRQPDRPRPDGTPPPDGPPAEQRRPKDQATRPKNE